MEEVGINQGMTTDLQNGSTIMQENDQRKRDENRGRMIMSIGWFLFAAKFIAVATITALVILYFIGKPLWLAPIIGIGIFTVYRLFWSLIWRLIG